MGDPKVIGAVAIPNGKNPLIERLAGAAAKLGVNRAKMNFGYIALLGTFSGALVVMAVVVGNVATKARNGGTNGNES